MLQNVIPMFRFQLYRHGWPAVVGIVLALCAVALQFLGVQEAQNRTVELRAEAVKQLQRQAARPDPDATANQRLVAFYESFPNAKGMLQAVETIHLSAAANGVKLATGDYRLVRDGSAKLQRYQMNLPAQASYASLHRWLAEVMNSVPSVSLDDISFQRDDVGSDSVEANVRLTLFLRTP